MTSQRRLTRAGIVLMTVLLVSGLVARSAAQSRPEGEMRWVLYVTLCRVADVGVRAQ
jgi:hypothetical protein